MSDTVRKGSRSRGARWCFGALALAAAVLFVVGPAQATGSILDHSFGRSGRLVTDFGPNDDWLARIAVQRDGRIIAAGSSHLDRSFSRTEFALARYTANGRLDPSFGHGGKVTTSLTPSDYLEDLALQRDGKILAAGTPSGAGFELVRYNRDGSLDRGFRAGNDPQAPGHLTSIALTPGGKIVAAGLSPSALVLRRYTADGTPDASFGAGGTVLTPFSSGADWWRRVRVRVQRDGKIVVAPPLDLPRVVVFRYTRAGTLDPGFGSGGIVVIDDPSHRPTDVGDLLIQPDGKLLVSYGQTLRRFRRDGSLDPSFGGGDGTVTALLPDPFGALALQRNGKILSAIADPEPLYGGLAVVRYHPNGTPDMNFGNELGVAATPYSDAFGSASAVAIQPSGRIIAGGDAPWSGAPFTIDTQFALAGFRGDTCIVPQLQDKRLAAAEGALRHATCAVGKVRKRFSGTVEQGRVIAQQPAASARVASATPVNLLVSKGKRRHR